MEFEGTLVSWDDAKGFGFLLPKPGGETIWAHIKSFDIPGRPCLHGTYRFSIETNARGQKRAVRIRERVPTAHRPTQRPHSAAAWGTASLFAIPLFVILYGIGLIFFHVPKYSWSVYISLSLIAFGMYAFDKSAASAGNRRIPERNLHLIALLSGWPGALIAQQVLRHKSVKSEFRAVFWGTVLVNITVFIGLSVWNPLT